MPQQISVSEFYPIVYFLSSFSSLCWFDAGSCYCTSFMTITSLQCSFCFFEASFPPQHRKESLAQKNRPKHSLRFSLTRRVSQTTMAKNRVIVLRKSIRTQTVANRQNERRAWSELSIPKAKAKQVVAEVVAMAGPAWERASWILV